MPTFKVLIHPHTPLKYMMIHADTIVVTSISSQEKHEYKGSDGEECISGAFLTSANGIPSIALIEKEVIHLYLEDAKTTTNHITTAPYSIVDCTSSDHTLCIRTPTGLWQQSFEKDIVHAASQKFIACKPQCYLQGSKCLIYTENKEIQFVGDHGLAWPKSLMRIQSREENDIELLEGDLKITATQQGWLFVQFKSVDVGKFDVSDGMFITGPADQFRSLLPF